MIIQTNAYPRVGLIGNPSDGYFGKTISFTFSNFEAQVALYETPELEILPNTKDKSRFTSIDNLVQDVELHGYYGGVRLLKATIKRFYDYCAENQIELHRKNFTIRYNSNIPHSVGLAGSSAIITACLRALMQFYGVSIPKFIQANLILTAETQELGISAGLQDRVIQVYQGLVFMDFNKECMDKNGYGRYESQDAKLLPRMFVAYRDNLSEPTERFHNNIRERYHLGDKKVVSAMKYWANLAAQFKRELSKKNTPKLFELIDANFDRRCKIYKIASENIAMVEAARSVGACAKFTGSGGAIVGIYENEAMFKKLRTEMKRLNIQLIKPKIV